MIALTAIVFSVTFVMACVQRDGLLAAPWSRGSPRPSASHALGVFMATFYALAALAWVDRGGGRAVHQLDDGVGASSWSASPSSWRSCIGLPGFK
jgi:hypothetical protein